RKKATCVGRGFGNFVAMNVDEKACTHGTFSLTSSSEVGFCGFGAVRSAGNSEMLNGGRYCVPVLIVPVNVIGDDHAPSGSAGRFQSSPVRDCCAIGPA